MNRHKLDRYDLNILRLLAQDGRVSKSKLADAVCLSVSALWERMKRLEDVGLISGYRAVVDWDAIRRHAWVVVEVSLSKHTAQHMQVFEDRVMRAPEVVQCYATGGGVDYVMHVRAKDIDHYQRFIDTLLLEDLAIERYFTYIVTKIVKRDEVPALELKDLEA